MAPGVIATYAAYGALAAWGVTIYIALEFWLARCRWRDRSVREEKASHAVISELRHKSQFQAMQHTAVLGRLHAAEKQIAAWPISPAFREKTELARSGRAPRGPRGRWLSTRKAGPDTLEAEPLQSVPASAMPPVERSDRVNKGGWG